MPEYNSGNYSGGTPFHGQAVGVTNHTSSGFLAKVIIFFGLALLVSAAGTFAAFGPISPLFLQYPFLIWVFFAMELVLVLTSRLWSAHRPWNYLLFAVFAFLSGVMIMPLIAGVILEFGGPALIIKALIATTLTFCAAAVIGWTTQRQLAGLRGFLLISLVGMLIISIMGIFFPWGNTFEMIFSGFGIVVFTLYTLYDIQKLKTYEENEYIEAALQLYLDIFNLFVYILRLMSGISRHN